MFIKADNVILPSGLDVASQNELTQSQLTELRNNGPIIMRGYHTAITRIPLSYDRINKAVIPAQLPVTDTTVYPFNGVQQFARTTQLGDANIPYHYYRVKSGIDGGLTIRCNYRSFSTNDCIYILRFYYRTIEESGKPVKNPVWKPYGNDKVYQINNRQFSANIGGQNPYTLNPRDFGTLVANFRTPTRQTRDIALCIEPFAGNPTDTLEFTIANFELQYDYKLLQTYRAATQSAEQFEVE